MPGSAAHAAAGANLVTQVIRSEEIALGQPQTYMYAPPAHLGDAHRIPQEFTGSDAHFAGERIPRRPLPMRAWARAYGSS